ncbi:MAG: PIN domain-containing protein [Acidobacteriia bacterium]|nr:PIN domain-containing protein [Terriglobia bacterium]
MTLFVDTSAFYAVVDHDDENHVRAARSWNDLLDGNTTLLTNNYVLLETSALLQHRLGPAALRAFQQEVVPLLTVDWISQQRHQAGVEAVLAAARRKLSLVDCISFQTMRQYGVQQTFCFDQHFRQQGFETIP